MLKFKQRNRGSYMYNDDMYNDESYLLSKEGKVYGVEKRIVYYGYCESELEFFFCDINLEDKKNTLENLP